MARKRIPQQICANCNYTFNQGENFCPNCGQENHSPNQPIHHYAVELTESLIHLDSKILMTIGTMLRYPGKITKEYNNNVRARFTPPVRLYIFISLAFFVLIQIPQTVKKISDNESSPRSFVQDSSDKENPPEDSIDQINLINLDKMDTIDIGVIKLRISKADIPKYKNAKPEQIDSLIIANGQTPTYFTRTLFRQLIKAMNADEDFNTRLQEKAIKFGSFSLFFLMPFFGFLVYLVYLRRKKYYYEYLIFSLHYHTVVFLILSLFILINIFIKIPAWIFVLVGLSLFFYLGKALRYNFGGSRLKTILKMCVVTFIYSISIFIVLIFVVLLGWWFV